MTRNRLEYGYVVIVALALFLFYRNFFFFYLLALIFLLPVISRIVTKQALSKLNFRVSFPAQSVTQGNGVTAVFEIENKSFFPLPGAVLEFKAENGFYPNEEIQQIEFPLRRGKRTYEWHIEPKYAGMISITGSKITVRDYLGIFLFYPECPFEASVCILPKRNEIAADTVEKLFADGEENESDTLDYTEDVTQVKDFRQYIPGDRMQKVNWKISAKHDELYVREYELENTRSVNLVTELRKDSEKPGFLDEIVSAFYSSAVRLIELEIPFYAVWYDSLSDKLVREFIEDAEGLENAAVHMFMTPSYPDYSAYEKYMQAESGSGNTALYFTSPSFERTAEHKIIGMYNESVAIICL